MPRRSTTFPEQAEPGVLEEKPVRRRRVTRAVSSEGEVERVGEVGSAKPLTTPSAGAEPVRTVRRKAPPRKAAETSMPSSAPVASVSEVRSSRRRVPPWVVVGVVFGGGLALSAFLGFSDAGTIDINAKISEQAQQSALSGKASDGDGEPALQNVPVQNTSVSVPNGGLRGRGVDSAMTPVVPPPTDPDPAVASSTATSSAVLATTTAPVAASSTDATPDASTPESS